jgi:hypothetical protein
VTPLFTLEAAPIDWHFSHMTSLGEIAQPSDCSLTHTLLAYWRKLLVPRSTEFSEVHMQAAGFTTDSHGPMLYLVLYIASRERIRALR